MNKLNDAFIDDALTVRDAILSHKIQIEFVIDKNFWAITPAFNWNNHSKSIEFEWLCFAMYIDVTNHSK